MNIDSPNLNILIYLIILKTCYPFITNQVLIAILDSKGVNPFDKDDFNCSPMFYSKLFQDVQSTSVLFDYIIFHKKQVAQKRVNLWFIKMKLKPQFFFRLKWKIQNKYIPFFFAEQDTVDLYKFGNKVLIQFNKVKGKGFSFKEYPTCIILKFNKNNNQEELLNLMEGSEFRSVSSNHNSFV